MFRKIKIKMNMKNISPNQAEKGKRKSVNIQKMKIFVQTKQILKALIFFIFTNNKCGLINYKKRKIWATINSVTRYNELASFGLSIIDPIKRLNLIDFYYYFIYYFYLFIYLL